MTPRNTVERDAGASNGARWERAETPETQPVVCPRFRRILSLKDCRVMRREESFRRGCKAEGCGWRDK